MVNSNVGELSILGKKVCVIKDYCYICQHKQSNECYDAKKSFYSSVPGSRLRSLAKSVRDYSKPTLNEIVEKARDSLNKAKPSKWIKIISTPMGGKNKR